MVAKQTQVAQRTLTNSWLVSPYCDQIPTSVVTDIVIISPIVNPTVSLCAFSVKNNILTMRLACDDKPVLELESDDWGNVVEMLPLADGWYASAVLGATVSDFSVDVAGAGLRISPMNINVSKPDSYSVEPVLQVIREGETLYTAPLTQNTTIDTDWTLKLDKKAGTISVGDEAIKTVNGEQYLTLFRNVETAGDRPITTINGVPAGDLGIQIVINVAGTDLNVDMNDVSINSSSIHMVVRAKKLNDKLPTTINWVAELVKPDEYYGYKPTDDMYTENVLDLEYFDISTDFSIDDRFDVVDTAQG